ncbi:MAG: hypothetical protein ACQZ3N_07035 [cyanobacterium endosymbiont of Rhopalodia yunnanensis]
MHPNWALNLVFTSALSFFFLQKK